MSDANDRYEPITVPEEDPPPTLKGLLRRATGESHRRLERLIGSGRVLVDGRPCRDPGHRPSADAKVIVAEAGAAAPHAEREPRARVRGPGFTTILEERELIVVSKAPGIVVIPTRQAGSAGTEDTTDLPLVARVAAALRTAGRRADPLWVIHRIDRETSGLVVFARSRSAYEQLRADFRRRKPRRRYLAWTRGVPSPRAGKLQHRLHEDRDTHRVEVAAAGGRGKLAVLEYETLAEGSLPDGTPIARLEVALTTGRRNQIRAQLAHEGWPLFGDRWYGPADEEPIARAALHAWHLAFDHPSASDVRVELEAPLPDDLRALDRHLRTPGPGTGQREPG
jgi:23S rRNA pseudouridine1911/1915/1917 synthase